MYNASLSLTSIPKMQSKMAHRVLLFLVGGLYPLGFSPFGYWPLSFISLVLLTNEIFVYSQRDSAEIDADDNEKQSKNRLSFYSMGLYWAYGAFGVGTSWVYVSINEYGGAPVVGAIAISYLFVLTLSVVKAAGIFLIGKMVRWFGLHLFILIVPFVWVVFEFMQTILFSGFPWLFAGYTQTDGPMWMLSTWFGVYGVSWFIMAMAACVVVLAREYYFFKINSQVDKEERQQEMGGQAKNCQANNYQIAKHQINRAVLVSLIIFMSFPILAHFSQTEEIIPDKNSIDVALVQPNISQNQKWDRRFFSKIIKVLDEQSVQHWDADLIVWPEGAIPAYKHQVEDILSDLKIKAVQSKTDLLLGLPIYQREDDLSFGSFISIGEKQQIYHKQVLVPFGEYVPYAKQLRGLIKFFDLPMSNFSPAIKTQTAMEFERYQVIPAICYEIAYPAIVHQLIRDADNASDKPKLLVTVSNDAWFGDSFGPYQHMQMARMRALELGIPLVRSTNDGVTAVVDARGRMLKRLKRYDQQTLRYELPLTYYPTLYRKYGLMGIYGLLIICMAVFAISWLISRKN